MAKTKSNNAQITLVSKGELPKLVFAALVFVGAIFFVLQQSGVLKVEEKPLEVRPTPVSVNPAIPTDVLERITPCSDPAVANPKPGLNCQDSYYAPGADPLPEAEGRFNPFE